MVDARKVHAALVLALMCMVVTAARAAIVMDWNTRAETITADKHLPPPVQGRTLARMHVAMFEAINAIERRYRPYRLDLVADRNTSREAAAGRGPPPGGGGGFFASGGGG